MKTIVQERQWRISSPDIKLHEQLSSETGIHPAISQLLLNRGIKTSAEVKDFLSKNTNTLHDPYLFKDMDRIVNRIISAVKNNEQIAVHGDYDADGLCGTALLFSILNEIGSAKCNYYLPNRIEGYGLSDKIIKKIKEDKTSLLITVDCGTSSVEEIALANSLGIDVIITDHHMPPAQLPDCFGIINPKIPDSEYPYNDLSGVGVVYKLAQALAQKTNMFKPDKYLDLVALGTIADIVPLTGENRILVHHGLEAIKNTGRTGLKKLKERVKLDDKIQAAHVAFRLAPRINACGRLSTAETSLKLLLSSDPAEAEELSLLLNRENYERQSLEQEVLKSAIEQVDIKFNFRTDKIIVVENRNWPVGVIGIVAGRLSNLYNRPAIVITITDGIGKGSGRSIKNFHLLDALTACKDHLIKHGGHAYAAGLSIEEINIPSFREMINHYADTVLAPEDLIPFIEIDAVLDFKDISLELIEQLDRLEPFGYGNSKPLFVSRNLTVHGQPVIVGKNHLKLWLKSNNKVIEAIGFDMGNLLEQFYEFNDVDLVYRLGINTWNNKQIIQLQIQDIRIN